MNVEFDALLKKISVKSLVSLDTEAEIVLRLQAEKEVLKKLIELQKADELVKVRIENG